MPPKGARSASRSCFPDSARRRLASGREVRKRIEPRLAGLEKIRVRFQVSQSHDQSHVGPGLGACIGASVSSAMLG